MSSPHKWQDDAECAQIGTEMFFPEDGGSTLTAKKICASCPVSAQCLELALSMGPGLPGVWGGTSRVERQALRRGAA